MEDAAFAAKPVQIDVDRHRVGGVSVVGAQHHEFVAVERDIEVVVVLAVKPFDEITEDGAFAMEVPRRLVPPLDVAAPRLESVELGEHLGVCASVVEDIDILGAE
jgi:hypothetical protein